MPSILHAPWECRCIKDAYQNPSKIWPEIWVGAKVGSKACQARKQAEGKIAIEMNPIVKIRQLKLRKPTIHQPTVVSDPVRPADLS